MSWSTSIRQIHRWVSIIFVVTVIVCFIAVSQEEAPEWVFYLPLAPLGLLAVTGLYMFVLPYVGRWRKGRGTD